MNPADVTKAIKQKFEAWHRDRGGGHLDVALALFWQTFPADRKAYRAAAGDQAERMIVPTLFREQKEAQEREDDEDGYGQLRFEFGSPAFSSTVIVGPNHTVPAMQATGTQHIAQDRYFKAVGRRRSEYRERQERAKEAWYAHIERFVPEARAMTLEALKRRLKDALVSGEFRPSV